MKALNNSDGLWTNLSVKEVEVSEYQAACCLNIRINRQAQVSRDPEITFDNETVPLSTLREVVKKTEQTGAINEEIKVKPPQR